MARENPADAIAHYERLAAHLWLAPKVGEVADTILDTVQKGRTAWGSLSGPYGFGKTAAAVSLWSHARERGFLAIPPLSCTNFDELAHGIAALAIAQAPMAEKKIRRLFKEVWTEGLDSVIRNDAERYEMTPQKLRRLFQDKLNTGQLTLDSRCHRLVEFLSRLGELATGWSKGLLVILDELQQLLGPLDARAIINFREFVWGMRTERAHCGVIIALDSLLESRLSRWATDILHRIREHGPSLQLSLVYTREFPHWLWGNLTSSNGSGAPLFNDMSLTKDVLVSLGQFVERTDISNGPRTVVDVFGRAAEYYRNTGTSYDIPALVEDIHRGRFRYFGEGAALQTALTQLFSDEYILQDQTREILVRTLAAFPLGCSIETLRRFIPQEKKLKKAKGDLFGPLLVELSDGLALEKLQQVRRLGTDWEQVFARCWETLPALDALAAHTPDILRRVLVPRLFPKGNPASPQWEQIADESRQALSGWQIVKGTFDESYPQREIALFIAAHEPESWPQDVDLCVVLLCDSQLELEIESSAELMEKDGVTGIVIRLPVMKPLERQVPADLERYRKYVQPEPFRPSTILSAVHDLEVYLGDLGSKDDLDAQRPVEEEARMRRAKAFVTITLDFIVREMIQGHVDLGSGSKIQLSGPELLQALFASACRRRFSEYETLVKTPAWREVLKTYRRGLRSPRLNSAARQGRQNLKMPKAEMMLELFEQTSTAAGDSFLRMLGPLAVTSGTHQEFSMRLAMHPAEVLLLNYIKSLKGTKGVPTEAGKQFLHHNGYIGDEAEEIIHLLSDRELLVVDKSGNLKAVQNAHATRNALLEKITVAERQLKRLDYVLPDAPSGSDSVKELQVYADMLEEHLASRVEEQSKDLIKFAPSLRQMIGTVLATNVETDWATTELSMHLKGVMTVLTDAKEDLLKALRKELKRVEEEVGKAGHTSVEWAVAWRRRRDSFLNTEEKLRNRVAQFAARAAALSLWSARNDQLLATGILCEKVRATDPGPLKILSRLVRDYREKFSLDTWLSLRDVDEFTERLQSVQSEVQGLLFRQVQAFNLELETLRRAYLPVLPSTPPPSFEATVDGEAGRITLNKTFQELYRWALAGFQAHIDNCRRLKETGLPWHDLTNERTSWKDVDRQVTKALQAVNGTADFGAVCQVGEKVLRMLNGFSVANGNSKGNGLRPDVYDNPLEPPDFEQLKEMFVQGRVMIRVEPREAKSQDRSA
ncbi:MAG: hypothetical protein LC803_18425 [Acidobacteria bacterium]|nr:hypothetical protein [Acidobacteriota bacterium]